MSFKLGDWVRSKSFENDGNEELLIKKLKVQQQVDFVHKYQEEWELWQPKKGEWCWFFTDKMKLDNVYILRKFTQMESDIEDNDMFGCEPTVSDKEEFESIKVFYKYCEPFIGNLPSFIKEK